MSTVNSNPQSSRVPSNRPDVFVLLLLVASLCLNVYLGLKVKQGAVPQSTAKLAPGMKIDPVYALGADGKPLTISYDATNKPTVLYVITPSCIWCKRNQANIDKLVEAKANDFRFIGLSLAEDGLKEYVDEHRLKFPVYAGVTNETVQSLGLGSTPQTIVVSSEGKILKVWWGAYLENKQPEVEAFFGIQLPGSTSPGN
ncbi:MAG TPA: TlpA disulfide reductase family protein [Pyrinomonadaceae bacterium]|nr:TlpA disulfide reductase family protein [Pyrinomonadaceae bacterium]